MTISLTFFWQYCKIILGSYNGKPIFECLAKVIKDYNNLDQGKAVLQEYDMNSEKVFILCIVTNLICQVHEKI